MTYKNNKWNDIKHDKNLSEIFIWYDKSIHSPLWNGDKFVKTRYIFPDKVPIHSKYCICFFADCSFSPAMVIIEIFWFDFCFTALQHILGHFGRGQLP